MELIVRLLELLKHSNQVAAEALSKAQCQIGYLIVMPCRSDKHSNQVAAEASGAVLQPMFL